MPTRATGLAAAVVICAYSDERYEDTLAAVRSVAAQEPAAAEIVVVVDHNAPLFRRLTAAGLPASVVASDGPPGLSGARNTGIGATDQPIIAFLDDDAEAQAGWLSALTEPFDDPRVVATGARIEPEWLNGRPAWFPLELDWVVGCTYRGMPETRADVRNVIGAGMAFRRSALHAAGGFHAAMGRGRRLPLGGEETELCIRLQAADPSARVVFEPAAIIRHKVPAARARVGYLLKRSFAEGVTKARLSTIAGAGSALSTERAYAARVLPAAVLGNLGDAVRRRRPEPLLRAAAIGAAVAAACVGFVFESVRGTLLRARGERLTRAVGASANRSLRILQVTPRFSPDVGGVETHTLEVARRLAARGHRVTIATTDLTGDRAEAESRDGFQIRRVRAWPSGRDWYLAPGLLRMVGSGRWDVIHLQGVHTLVPPLGALAAILGRRRFVLTFHSGGHSSQLRSSLRGIQWRLLRPLLSRAAGLIGVSRFEAQRFAGALALPIERFEHIPNGAELPPAPAEPVMGQESAGPTHAPPIDADPLIISLGRLERYKGHHRVVAAMPAILADCPGARLHIAGSGPYESELRDQVAHLGLDASVTIGAIPHDALGSWLANARLVTLLSDYEAHPVAVMEAVAARCRVLAADTTGFVELAEQGLVRTIPVDADPEVVAAAMLEELARPRPDTIVDLPTWDDTTDALERVYRRVATVA